MYLSLVQAFDIYWPSCGSAEGRNHCKGDKKKQGTQWVCSRWGFCNEEEEWIMCRGWEKWGRTRLSQSLRRVVLEQHGWLWFIGFTLLQTFTSHCLWYTPPVNMRTVIPGSLRLFLALPQVLDTDTPQHCTRLIPSACCKSENRAGIDGSSLPQQRGIQTNPWHIRLSAQTASVIPV